MECKSTEVTYTLENWLFKPIEAKEVNNTHKEKIQEKITQDLKSRILVA